MRSLARQKAKCMPIGILLLQESKNISYKMLKDVGMTVPKSRETSEVYYSHMQQHRRMRADMQQDKG